MAAPRSGWAPTARSWPTGRSAGTAEPTVAVCAGERALRQRWRRSRWRPGSRGGSSSSGLPAGVQGRVIAGFSEKAIAQFSPRQTQITKATLTLNEAYEKERGHVPVQRALASTRPPRSAFIQPNW